MASVFSAIAEGKASPPNVVSEGTSLASAPRAALSRSHAREQGSQDHDDGAVNLGVRTQGRAPLASGMRDGAAAAPTPSFGSKGQSQKQPKNADRTLWRHPKCPLQVDAEELTNGVP